MGIMSGPSARCFRGSTDVVQDGGFAREKQRVVDGIHETTRVQHDEAKTAQQRGNEK